MSSVVLIAACEGMLMNMRMKQMICAIQPRKTIGYLPYLVVRPPYTPANVPPEERSFLQSAVCRVRFAYLERHPGIGTSLARCHSLVLSSLNFARL